jgi:large subunit ribosomal protein L32
MPVPKRRQSKTRIRKRRTHDSLTAPQTTDCPHCHKPIMPHRVCAHCGYYKGRSVVPVVEKVKEEK